MRILIDMDDVMIDFLQHWIDVLNGKFNKNVKYNDIYCWSMQVAYPDLTREQIFDVLYNEEFWADISPKQGAITYIRRLIQDGHEIYVVTASDPLIMKFRQVYILNQFFPWIPQENVIMAHNKQMILGDVLVDDNPKNLVNGNYRGLLMTAPHNQGYPERLSNLIRVNSWEEVYDLIDKIEKGIYR